MRPFRPLVASTALLSIVACGGGGSGASSADDADSRGGSARGSASGWGDGEGGDAEPSGPDCGDGTCLVCGDAFCPTGFFCDETNDPPACSWLPTCATDAGCGCLTRVMPSDCSCEDRERGAYVSCS